MGDLLNKKFPVFKIFRIQVYVHILFLFFIGYELWQEWDHPGWALLVVTLGWVSVLLHEFGHCWGARHQGGDATEVILWPLGGLALCDAPQTPWSQGFVAASGPAVNVVLALVGYGLRQALPTTSDAMYRAVGFHPYDVGNVLLFWNVVLFVFNLLPAFPMDMGRIFHAVLWSRKGYQRSLRIAIYTSFVCAGGLIVFSLADRIAPKAIPLAAYVGGDMTFFIAIWVLNSAWIELQKLNAGYFEELDEPWRNSFKIPAVDEPVEPEPGFIARWAARREEAREKKEADDAQARAARLDEVLRRVAQVGMDGLTPDEKGFLEQESARLREKR